MPSAFLSPGSGAKPGDPPPAAECGRRMRLDRALVRSVASLPRARRPSSSARGLIPVPGRTRQEIIAEDVRDLAGLGYTQQLFREMGGFSNFAISFSIISVLTGAVLLFGYGLKLAGPIVNSVGWPVVSLFTLAVAASMAELASAYPTAGGLYFWAHRLGGRGWGWVTAWINMLGQVTIAAGIDVAAAIYLVGAVCRILGISPDLPLPLVGSLGSWSCSLVVMVLIMVPQVLINALGIRLTARLNDLSVWWHVGGVSLLVLLLGVFGRIHHPLAFAFSAVNTVNPLDASSATFADGTAGPALTVGSLVLPSPLFALVPGLVAFYRSAPIPFVFALALLQAQWTYTGYDASVHVAEETVMARLNSAWGVFLSVAVSAVVGYAMLLALTLAIPDVAATAADPYPVLHIVYANLGPLPAHLLALVRSEEHTSELQSHSDLVCRLLLEKKKKKLIHKHSINNKTHIILTTLKKINLISSLIKHMVCLIVFLVFITLLLCYSNIILDAVQI